MPADAGAVTTEQQVEVRVGVRLARATWSRDRGPRSFRYGESRWCGGAARAYRTASTGAPGSPSVKPRREGGGAPSGRRGSSGGKGAAAAASAAPSGDRKNLGPNR